MRRTPSALVVGLALALAASSARAQGAPTTRAMPVTWADGVPHLRVDLRDVADADLVAKLRSGLPQTLVMRAYAYRGEGEPIAIGVRQCRVVFDLWEETYRVEVQTESADRARTLASTDDVLRACLSTTDMPVGTSREWASASRAGVWFALLVELNPLSPDTVHRIRRWLARPGGSQVGGDAFFGSFVSLFVNRRMGEAERTFRFRTPEAAGP